MASLKANPERVAERCHFAGVGYPQDRVFRGLCKGIAAQVSEVDKAD